MPSLRPYQLDAVKAIFRELYYRQSTLRVAATGSGKTAELGAVARIWLRRYGKRVLVTAPRGELLVQGKKWVERWMPGLKDGRDIGIEQATQRAHPGNRVIFGSLDSLSDDRLRQLPEPDLLILDEAHLHVGAQARIIEAFPKAKRAGFSATPDRLDQIRLLPHLYESVAAVYGVTEAIRDGFLCPVNAQRVAISALNLERVDRDESDFKEKSLSQAMRDPRVLATTCGAIAKMAGRRQTIVFAVDLAHAEEIRIRLSPLLKSHKKDPVRAVSGNMPQWLRDETLDGFREGEFQFLVSVALVTYGYDAPATSCIALARPTLSRALHSQMIGRGLRPLDGKKDCLVLDIVGNTDELTLVTPMEALEHGDDEIRDLVVRSKEGKHRDEEVEEALDESAKEAEPVPASTAHSYRVIPVDNQLSLIGVDAGAREHHEKPATVRQVELLSRFGVESADLLGMKQASALIDKLMERRSQGWCTLRQARYLQAKRLDPNQKFDVANEAISAIKGNRGRVPKTLLAKLAYRREETLVLG